MFPNFSVDVLAVHCPQRSIRNGVFSFFIFRKFATIIQLTTYDYHGSFSRKIQVMKYFLIFFAGMCMIFASCKKRPTPLNCYTCITYDSTVSNYPAFISADTALIGQDTICHFSGEEITSYMQTHIKLDTVKNRNDTFIAIYSTIQCLKL